MDQTLKAYKNIWVIGASKGIGASLVKALDAPDRHLYLSARDGEALDKLAASCRGRCTALPLDICDDNAVDQLGQRLLQEGQENAPLDMVVLNAGTCEYMDSEQLDLALLERVMRTNFFALVKCMDVVLPLLRQHLKAKGSGASPVDPKLVVMSSSVTYQALPRAHAYGASKAALRYFTECLKADIQKEGIDVRLVSPGFVKTPLTAQNDFDMPFMLEADEAAKRIVNGLEGRRFDIAFPFRFTSFLKGMALLPDSWRFKLLARMSRHTDQHDTRTGTPNA